FDGSSSKEGFIQFSAYRITPHRVVAMGLMPLTHHDVITAQHCWWESANGQWTDGAISVKFPGEHHARAYECVLLYCDLQRPVSSMVGGTLKMAVDQQDVVVYKESPGTPEPPPEVREDVRVFERNLTYCSAPMFGAIDTQRLLEWIEFHRSVHGVDYLRMYDAGAMDDDVMAALRPYLRAGIMDITDIRGAALYDTWSYAQVLMVNDCALRSRQLTQWVLFMDVDEYIHVVEPPHSLLVFLNSVPAIPWLSFGSLTFPLDICGKIQEAGWEPWAVEQLVFREPVPHCKEPTKYYSRDACLKWDGHRKYVVNPRAAQVLQIHRVYELNAAYDANAPPDAAAAASGAAAAALLATSGREEGSFLDFPSIPSCCASSLPPSFLSRIFSPSISSPIFFLPSFLHVFPLLCSLFPLPFFLSSLPSALLSSTLPPSRLLHLSFSVLHLPPPSQAASSFICLRPPSSRPSLPRLHVDPPLILPSHPPHPPPLHLENPNLFPSTPPLSSLSPPHCHMLCITPLPAYHIATITNSRITLSQPIYYIHPLSLRSCPVAPVPLLSPAPPVAKLDMGGTGFPPRDDDGGGGGGGGGGGRF
ncbi:unnamed protein product, partial [Closterium sp. Naga37s-1]